MWVIGILGGIASGKSYVAAQLERLGARVIDADRIGHEVLHDPEVIHALRERWGSRILDQDGKIIRSEVARLVFADNPSGTQELAFLERTTHPKIGERIRDEIDSLAARGDVPAVVIDAALLVKAGWIGVCDKVLYVEASEDERLQRARERGWSKAEFESREAAQEKLDQKKNRADWVIDNAGSPEHTFAQVQQFWHSLD